MEYVVSAEFRARAARVAEFGEFIDRHAAASREEPGCLVFDVCQDPDDKAVYFLYEVYRDEEAYQAHRATAHYGRFFEIAGTLLEPSGETLFVSRRVLVRRPHSAGGEEPG